MGKSAVSFAKKILLLSYKIESVINIFLVLSAMTLVVAQVILRYVLKLPLMGIEELLVFPTIWMYMIGGATASYERSHIECGIMTLYLHTETSVKVFNLIKTFLSSAIGIWLMYWSFWFFEYGLRIHKTSAVLRMPMKFAQSAVFVGLLLMVVYALRDLFMSIVAFSKKSSEGEN